MTSQARGTIDGVWGVVLLKIRGKVRCLMNISAVRGARVPEKLELVTKKNEAFQIEK